MVEEKIAQHTRIGFVRSINIAVHLFYLLRTDVEQVCKIHVSVCANLLYDLLLDERIVSLEPCQSVCVVLDIGNTE